MKTDPSSALAGTASDDALQPPPAKRRERFYSRWRTPLILSGEEETDGHGELRNPSRESFQLRLRLTVTSVLVVLAFGALVARFFHLQVSQHEYYLTRAEDNRITVLPIVPTRGTIADRNGEVLARNFSAYTLEIDPSRVEDLEVTINNLAELVEIEPIHRRRFRRLMSETKGVGYIPVRTRLTDEEVARVAARLHRFPGVEIRAKLYREYPLGQSAAHLLGYIGRVSAKDVERLQEEEVLANYRGTEHIGKIGVERTHENELHGETGAEQVEVDAGGRPVRTLESSPPRSGSNLTLTVDYKLQEVAERAFGKRRGALVAIEPSTGEVLALVSMPTFDPNLFIDGIDQETWEALNDDPDHPLLNRAIYGTYPPGSTYKPFMALAALELGRRTAQQAISDPGYFWYGGHKFRDDKVGGHGSVDMYKSIVVSCDTYYYQLSQEMGIDTMAGFMSQFGFGEKTGIDLTGEASGILPSTEWKRKRYKQKWFGGETISAGIGQGYNAYTPLQLANAVATLANGGTMYRPHVVRQVEMAKNGERRRVEPEVVRQIPLKPENLEVIRRAMVGVNREGTARGAMSGTGYTVAGKTGTSQVVAIKQNEKYDERRVKERHRDHALYVAFAPVDKPRIALAVLVENAGFGAKAAAPIARQVLDYYLLGRRSTAPADELEDSEDGHD